LGDSDEVSSKVGDREQATAELKVFWVGSSGNGRMRKSAGTLEEMRLGVNTNNCVFLAIIAGGKQARFANE
jgi:hypothetical protein